MTNVVPEKPVAPTDEPIRAPEPPVLHDCDSGAGNCSPSIYGSFRAAEALPVEKPLPENEKLALEELKRLLREAVSADELISKNTQKAVQIAEGEEAKADESDSPPPADLTLEDETNADSPPICKTVEAIEETVVKDCGNGESVSIWGIPLLEDERTDVVLWKFLRARDFKVKEAFTMLKSTLQWRSQFGIDDKQQQERKDLEERVVFMHGFSKQGHPICYNVYGEFSNKNLYQETFADEEKRQGFLKWRIQFLERSIRKLDFRPGGVSTIVQINDLKDSPGIGKSELRNATKQALNLLQDNYPELVAKQVFINVPWWYMAVHKMISPFLTQRTKSKFVFAGPSKTAETLFNYIAAEQIPVQYGGLSKDGEFSDSDPATHIIVKPSSKETVEFSVTEACQLTWEVRVLGWEVSYGAEFVPNVEDGYTVIIQKMKKISANGEGVIINSFKVGESGKVILTIQNSSSKKKRLLYRLKSKSLAY